MAGMFYSLTETAEKLGIADDAVKQLAKEGKLREFRDGSNILFKIEEVEALLAEGVDIAMEPQGAAPEEELAEALEAEPTPASEEPLEEPLEEDMFELTEEETPVLEPSDEAEAISELGLASESEEKAEEAPQPAGEEDFFPMEEEELPAAEAAEEEEEEISLAPESGMLGTESDITDMDTALTGEGVSVLGETDADYAVTDDSMSETVGPAGTGTEASLEEIEDDVNLDSFGSGSGLLDLSLQADDTSLGGILDEIYTAEGAEEGQAAAEPGLVEDMAAEAEHAMPEEDLGTPEPVTMVPTVTAGYVEAAPDSQSNILGTLLFLPLAALLYTAIVAVAAQRNIMPSILESIQGMVWYIMGGAVVVTGLVVGVSFVAGGDRTKAGPRKARKAKAAKKEKPKKEKKAKAEKPKKEKKPRSGKKK